MKIALLHYTSPPIIGGVESVLAHHARLMNRAGHEVVILAGRGAEFDANIPVKLLPVLDSRHEDVLKVKSLLDKGSVPPEMDTLCSRISQQLQQELQGVDVLIAHNVASLHKNLALTAAIHQAYRSPGFPRLILWHHDLAWTTPRYSKEMYAGYPWDLLRDRWQGACHVVVSRLRQQELSDLIRLPAGAIRVVPNGVDRDMFFKLEERTIQIINQLKLGLASPLLLLPVRLTPRKNIELALQVTNRLRSDFPAVRLLVTGPEGAHNPANVQYKQKLLALRDALHLHAAAHFLAELSSEFIPDAVIADLYRLADGLIFPSFEEGFGIPLIEAGFSGLPVFCSDIAVLRELGGDDVTYFYPDDDPSNVARKIAGRLNAEASLRWARRARHAYNWDSIYEMQIEPLIQEVVE